MAECDCFGSLFSHDYGCAKELEGLRKAGYIVAKSGELVVYQVWYWDPCSGIGGRSKDCGLFESESAAQSWIAAHRDPSPMEDNAYKITPREVGNGR